MKELIAYITILAGSALDHISTLLVLRRPDIYEANQIAIFLMNNNLWLAIDALVLGTGIGIPAVIMRKWAFPNKWGILAYPITLGLLRLFFGIWNLHWMW